jgi:hypothetical protein
MTKTMALALGWAVAAALTASTCGAQTLKPDLAPLGFLVGDWSSADGAVADTGERASGTSHITIETGGAVLLRRDHTELRDAKGKPTGGFDQIMTIYPEAGGAGAPGFRLTYRLTGAGDLALTFAMVPPGGGEPRPIASGVLHKAN